MGRLRLRSKAGRKASHGSDGGDDLIKKKNFKELGVTYASIDPFDPSSFGYMQIGTIVGPHGVKGEVKIKMDTDFCHERIFKGAIVYVKKPSRRAPRPIELVESRAIARGSGSAGGTGVFLVKIKGISSRIGAVLYQFLH